MTETTTISPQPAGPAGQGPSGLEVARVALHAARKAAKQRGATGPTRTPRRRTRTVRPDGRDPAGLAAVLQQLLTERAWEVPAAGGTVLDRWPAIAAAVAPRLADHLQAVGFHAESGRLDLRPTSPAYATQARLITDKLIAAANQVAGAGTVKTIRVLPPGAVTSGTGPATADPGRVEASTTPVDEAPVHTRQTASPGYQQALAAYRAAKQPRTVDPEIQAAAAAQDASPRMREPERLFHEARDVQAEQRATSVDASRARALRRLAAERVGLDTSVPRQLSRPE